jgi:hypothetical protein
VRASGPPPPPGKPFDISDCTAMLEQAAVTARELEGLAQRSDALAPARLPGSSVARHEAFFTNSSAIT